MTDIAISVENLGKSYLVGHNAARSERYTALRDVLSRNARNLARKTRDMFGGRAIVQGDEVEEFWALNDVSFEIRQGDCVGIIGRNGAGKSTLLKVLSRITEPTSGRIKIAGRVASLLEVGTGFHPELTGRENVFLNGAILGMTRREIQRKFDEIVAFAEVEKFLDTPVKRYSSGMYVRLAFAVAAHLEPEILIVDEVLAVGDAQFQKKCLGKMGEVGQAGRTVLFVSHNLDAINTLCESAILLKNGKLEFSGSVDKVIRHYMEDIEKQSIQSGGTWIKTEQTPGLKKVTLSQFGSVTDELVCGENFVIEVEIEISLDCNKLELGFGFIDENGRDILRVNNKHLNCEIDWPRCGLTTVRINVPYFNWIVGDYIYLGIYFGYIEERYEEYQNIIRLKLIKVFNEENCTKIVERVNSIYIDGVKFN